ncbi:TPA: G5P family DNA-binding protein [Vibrio alginolyticus]|uniref:single-stranded DNA-binding protein n=1 Tax=Vibrio alginolyticus TaxID=663 RepID=UPI001BD6C0BE|nr:single-stranded DNA-binding protein [Vibrio alginolyticus]EKZ8663028.1 G5P family DNA-binding protein [Vibrio alginolyticus]MBS9991544.1 G5P family DNA-binding protein [Vibrio alginolyticus]MBS9991549.1 G5P family DNA-binding protein [Vibrio alginolyticus]HCZ9263769.1 G5P family DNA-binding protein [Vibrio alginolyticus]HCZ9303481.1 G5P family DNA-binding protein [Vibrio alginolyticus]
MLKVEIFPEHEQIETRTIPGKDDKPSRTIYEQIAYAYLGGKFPVEMKLSLEKDESTYRTGTYTVDSSSFVINSYGKLELKKYGMKLTPMEVDL